MITRRPYVEKRISEISDGDKVRITGVVVDSFESEIILDDGSGVVRVILPEPKPVDGLVQVFGKVFMEGMDKIIKADIVREVNGLNIGAYKKLMGLEG